MSCRFAKFDGEMHVCDETGDQCLFMIPSEHACYEMFHEGPLAFEEEDAEEGTES
jgi:hypothetical protein